ncbi:histone-lysine N-methyltransferase SETMAR-like [Octopus bimaculoides]|uniref:histone-lysine N-methyltransferase SETMAR-like n=1 Tax=Octopus bimaculoides TaxID=37653 RepID=UPI00071D802B|nr:histone-lysine N-methyltransferase SETMAR-like [Octopus bimaculoides]|eukprot:XP_014773786.1 PREDICTED: histone-lysine N-methyltransferase SETMAR-like [Octopus bimaculoides]
MERNTAPALYCRKCISTTALIMSAEKIAIRTILRDLWKNGLSARTMVKELNDVEGPGIANEGVAQNWFRSFKESDINHEDKPKSWRRFVEDEALLEIVEQLPSTSNRTLPSEFNPSQSTITTFICLAL